MKGKKNTPYFAVGITAFLVFAATILLYFMVLRFDLICLFFSTLSYILRPITFGLVLAFLLLPLQRRITSVLSNMAEGALCRTAARQKLTKFLAIFLSLLILFVLVYLLLAMVIPQVYISVVGLIQAMPGYIRSAHSFFQEFLKNNPEVQAAFLPVYDSFATSVQEWLQFDLLPNLESVNSTLKWLETEFWPSFSSVATGVSSVLFAVLYFLKDLLIAVIVSVYLLVRKDTFAAQSKKIVYSIFKTRHADIIVQETRNAYRILSGFIIGKLIDSLIIGLLCLFFCDLFRFPYPTIIATVVGVTNIIPFFGPFIGAIPCILLIFLVNPMQSVYFALFILVLQQFDGNILGPKILGDSTGLDAFWVLFSILLFGGLFGFTGMVFGVPVFAMIYSILNRLVRSSLRRRGLPVETGEYMGKTAPMAKTSLDFDGSEDK